MACVEKVSPVVKKPNRVVKGFNPSAVPIIRNIEPDGYINRTYGEITIHGDNFLPDGMTYVLFGTYVLNVTYNSSFGITFYLPIQVPNDLLKPGDYTVQVVNRYSKFKTPGENLYSNKQTFTIYPLDQRSELYVTLINGDKIYKENFFSKIKNRL
jgi:hypothetical protein